MFQTIYGNFPMLVRWKAHRYILGQSLEFFHNEFAGRVSQKVMQTALAVRETVTKVLDVFVYVDRLFHRYAGSRRPGRPLACRAADRLAGGLYRHPRSISSRSCSAISSLQADARAQMTGRVVDSYTNIQTIKLFAHTLREQDYARDAMDEFLVTVHGQMRLVTKLTVCAAHRQFAAARLRSRRWRSTAGSRTSSASARSPWRSPWSCASAPCRSGSCGRSPAFSRTSGTVEDGINTIAQPVTITDRPAAKGSGR